MHFRVENVFLHWTLITEVIILTPYVLCTCPTLRLSASLQAFRWFLRSEFSEENLAFWLACEEYKNMAETKLPSKAQSIYTQFINPDAPQEVLREQLALIASQTTQRFHNVGGVFVGKEEHGQYFIVVFFSNSRGLYIVYSCLFIFKNILQRGVVQTVLMCAGEPGQ